MIPPASTCVVAPQAAQWRWRRCQLSSAAAWAASPASAGGISGLRGQPAGVVAALGDAVEHLAGERDRVGPHARRTVYLRP
jgi:hypothetical protein